MINLLENYSFWNQAELPPLKLLLIAHARALHERQVDSVSQILTEQRNDEWERLRAAAAAKLVPLEAARDAEIANVMEAARKRCAKITAKYEAQINPIRCDLQRDLDSCDSKCSHAIEQRKEPMKTAIYDAANEGRRIGWKPCQFHDQYEDGSPGCHVWFRPEDEKPDCGFDGCDRHLAICLVCRSFVDETITCGLCEECDCEEGHKDLRTEDSVKEPENFCDAHWEQHSESCFEAHSSLCGFHRERGKMMPGYCQRTITTANEANCVGECGVRMCQECAWRCDGVQPDDGRHWSGSGGTRECGQCFCKQCLPTSLKAELDRQLARGDVWANVYCGDCLYKLRHYTHSHRVERCCLTDAMINLLENYSFWNQAELPPLKLLLIAHARALHELSLIHI